MMTFGSVCSGIGSPEVAWGGLGWHSSFVSEIDKFPRAVLERRFGAGTGNGPKMFGDFTAIKESDIDEPIDLLVGGTPCQDFSVAGKRAGLDGERGNLTLEFARLARRLGARWMVWENVPGAFTLNAGNDFGSVLACFAGYPEGSIFAVPADGWKNAGVVPPAGPHGHGLAWRVLDAQFTGVPQRRRRIILVGYLGDWRPAAAVLFEPESLRGDTPPRREAGEGVARPIACGSERGSGYRNDADTADSLVVVSGFPMREMRRGERGDVVSDVRMVRARAFGGNNTQGPIDVATAVRAKGGTGHGDFESETFVAHAFKASHFTRGKDGAPPDVAPPLSAEADRGDQDILLAFTCKDHGADAGGLAPTLRAMGFGSSHANGGGQVAIAGAGRVRRLTPKECERLQGLPDDWTAITYRGKPAADGPRYKAIGNSMATTVMRWVGERIDAVNSVLREVA